MRIGLLLIGLAALSGCETLKPYEKEFLLHPTMDDATVTSLSPAMVSGAAGSFEKLGSGSGASGATSCPTCGG